jgi:PAS domain-containing protein
MIRPRSWSIRSHLFALVVFTVLPLLVLLVQAVVLETRQGLEVAERTSRAAAQTTATSVHRFFREAELVLGSMATRSAVRAMEPEPCRELLAEFLGVLPRFANLFVVDADGGVVCSALPAPPGGFDPVVDREWFRRAVSERVFQAGSPQVGRISGRWVSVLASPVLDAEGELQGVIGGAIDLIGFQDLLAQVSLPEGSVLTIDDLDGVVVARSLDPEGWVGRRLPPSGLSPDILQQPGGSTRVPGAEGVERVWGFTAIEGTPWRVWAGIPVSEVVAPVRQAALRKAILIGLALLTMGGVSLLLYRRVSTSLRNLVEATDRVGSGEDGSIPEHGPDEVRKVAAQFNRTLEARSRAETDRRRSLERYRSVLDHAVFGILVTGTDDRIREANPALARIVGAPSAEALRGQPVVALFQRPDEALALRAGLEGGTRVAGVQTTWVTRGGSPSPSASMGACTGMRWVTWPSSGSSRT